MKKKHCDEAGGMKKEVKTNQSDSTVSLPLSFNAFSRIKFLFGSLI